MVSAIEKWCKEHGKKHYDEIREQREDERMQKAGLESMRNVAVLLKQFAPYFEFAIKKGTVGDEHAEPAATKLAGKQKEKSKSVEGEAQTLSGTGHTGSDTRGGEASGAHRPFTVTGPKGKRRTVVRDDSLGLQLSHMAMEDTDEPWVFEPDIGRVTINTLHPDWEKCEGDERKWKQYQEVVLLTVGLRQTHPADIPILDRQAYESTSMLARLICTSPSFGAHRKASS